MDEVLLFPCELFSAYICFGRGKRKEGLLLFSVSLMFSIVSGIYYFNIENHNELGQANYCRIRDDASETDLRGCASVHFNQALGTCPYVYLANENSSTYIHEKFNLILLLLFIGWTSTVLSGILQIIG